MFRCGETISSEFPVVELKTHTFRDDNDSVEKCFEFKEKVCKDIISK